MFLELSLISLRYYLMCHKEFVFYNMDLFYSLSLSLLPSLSHCHTPIHTHLHAQVRTRLTTSIISFVFVYIVVQCSAGTTLKCLHSSSTAYLFERKTAMQCRWRHTGAETASDARS